MIETPTARIWLDDEGILRGVLAEGAAETLAGAQANVAAAATLAAGRMVPVLIDLRSMRSITQEARHYYAGEDPARYARAQALLVGSPLSRLIGNFFIGLNKARFPVRLFTSEDGAIAWLKEACR
jgi:hypothetical protein